MHAWAPSREQTKMNPPCALIRRLLTSRGPNWVARPSDVRSATCQATSTLVVSENVAITTREALRVGSARPGWPAPVMSKCTSTSLIKSTVRCHTGPSSMACDRSSRKTRSTGSPQCAIVGDTVGGEANAMLVGGMDGDGIALTAARVTQHVAAHRSRTSGSFAQLSTSKAQVRAFRSGWQAGAGVDSSVGDGDGSAVLGRWVGFEVGDTVVGTGLGAGIGASEGSGEVGDADGNVDGAGVNGIAVGAAVGVELVGSAVGVDVGPRAGVDVVGSVVFGFRVGAAVGPGVGDSDGCDVVGSEVVWSIRRIWCKAAAAACTLARRAAVGAVHEPAVVPYIGVAQRTDGSL